MRIALRALEAEDLLEKEPFDIRGRAVSYDVKREGYAQSFLISRCGDAALEIVKGTETVNEMWKRLRSQYLATGWLAESTMFS